MESRLYFAYGSNMDPAQMAVRCPGARPAGRALLPDYRFLINTRGVATVAAEAGARVHGLLWEITEAHVHALDGFEGVPKGRYYRDFLKVCAESGERLRPLIYIDPIAERGVPKEKYMEQVYGAAEAAGFPPAYLAELRAWLPPRRLSGGFFPREK